jgi:hypothetical protein
MNQALYAHMNNKRKMKKKKENTTFWLLAVVLRLILWQKEILFLYFTGVGKESKWKMCVKIASRC